MSRDAAIVLTAGTSAEQTAAQDRIDSHFGSHRFLAVAQNFVNLRRKLDRELARVRLLRLAVKLESAYASGGEYPTTLEGVPPDPRGERSAFEVDLDKTSYRLASSGWPDEREQDIVLERK
jgi:hypothetical protein